MKIKKTIKKKKLFCFHDHIHAPFRLILFGIWQWKGDYIENNLRNVVKTEENQVIGQQRLKVSAL